MVGGRREGEEEKEVRGRLPVPLKRVPLTGSWRKTQEGFLELAYLCPTPAPCVKVPGTSTPPPRQSHTLLTGRKCSPDKPHETLGS